MKTIDLIKSLGIGILTGLIGGLAGQMLAYMFNASDYQQGVLTATFGLVFFYQFVMRPREKKRDREILDTLSLIKLKILLHENNLKEDSEELSKKLDDLIEDIKNRKNKGEED